MDAASTQWCSDSKLSAKTVAALTNDEFTCIEALQAMTADVVDGYELSKAQNCLLKKAIMKLQTNALQGSTQGVKSTKSLDETINCLERELTASGDEGEGKSASTLRTLRPHEVLYIRPKRRPDGKEIKVVPTDISYSEFIAGSLIIMDRMIKEETHSQEAHEFCQYLKFLTKKATAFRAASVLEFDDEFRSELTSATGDASSFADLGRMTEIAAHHFDASTAIPRNNPRSQNPGQGSTTGTRSKGRTSDGTKSFCFKWNQNQKSCSGCNYQHLCQVCESPDHGLNHHKKQ